MHCDGCAGRYDLCWAGVGLWALRPLTRVGRCENRQQTGRACPMRRVLGEVDVKTKFVMMMLAAAGVVGSGAVAQAQPPPPPPDQPPPPPPAEFGVAPAALPPAPTQVAPPPTVSWGTNPSADTTNPDAVPERPLSRFR